VSGRRPGGRAVELLSSLGSRAELEAFCRGAVRLCPVRDTLAVVRVLGRPLLLLDTRDVGIAVHLAMDGFWEAWVTLAVARHIRPGWRCVDVGANWGYYTVLLASLVGEAGRVWACEPNPALLPCLRHTLSLNGFGRTVELVEAAVVDRPGRLSLRLPPSDLLHTGGASVVFGHPGGGTFSVAGLPLDDVCRGERVDFIKVDAEGAERQVWDGMSTLRRANPGLTVLMEYNASRYEDPVDFVRRIVDDGFTLREVGTDGALNPVSAGELGDAGRPVDRMLWLERGGARMGHG
jgi:FkbM family methyltransferase